MAATADHRKTTPVAFSSRGPRLSDSNVAVKKFGIGIPWPWPLNDTPDVAGAAVPTLFAGTAVRTSSDPTAGGIYDISAAAGDKFTDDLEDILDAGTADFLAMLAGTGEAVGDMFVLGFDKDGGVPVNINITLSTAGVGGAGTWKYLAKDGTWKAFAEIIDESVGLTAGTSNYDVLWQIPTDWAAMIEDEVDSTPRYYLAFEITTVYSTNPAGTEVTALTLRPAAMTLAPQAPATGIITHIQWAGTAGGGVDFDTVLQFYNWTRGTRGIATLTGNPVAGRVALSTPLYVQRGDEVTIGAVQIEGSDELDGLLSLFLEIEI